MNYEILQSNVARGVALLNERTPGWAEHIALDRLEMRLCARCILGQLFPHKDFIDAHAALGLNVEEGDQYGFDIPDLDMDEHIDPAWDTLDNLWTEEVKRRIQS